MHCIACTACCYVVQVNELHDIHSSKMSYEYLDNLDHVPRVRYEAKLQAAGLELCPYKEDSSKWINDPTKWPTVQYPDIYSYLVESPGVFTKEAMKNYRSLEAHTYFVSGWVDTIHHMKPSSHGSFVMRANVKPSQRLNAKPHHPWVIVQRDGTVVSAHCDCMAGLGESCSHVAALLFKVEAAVRLGYTKVLGTDQLCVWNQCFTKKVEAAPIHRIVFYKESCKERLRQRRGRCVRQPARASPQQQDEFLQNLVKEAPDCVGLSTFNEHNFKPAKDEIQSKSPKLPLALRTLYHPDNVKNLETSTSEAIEKLVLSEEQLTYLTEQTSQQADSPIWHDKRLGRITASKVHAVLHTNPLSPAPSVLRSICCPSLDISSVPAIKWGKTNEKVAGNEYAEAMKSLHKDLTVSPTGLWLSKDHPYLGASPDSIVKCSCGTGVVEIKCPFKHKDHEITSILADKSGCLQDVGGVPCLKESHNYYTQIQTQLYVCNAQYGDFVLWTLKTLVICRIPRNDLFINRMLHEVGLFWHEHCLPELLSRKLELGGENFLPIQGNSYPHSLVEEE